ncbi:EVE domain-containing protein [Clostridium estertheticum]|uniref:EVE domain-containing protein n=1 Tax=Clostridium estertheticum TaxID=238834 RepID=UPI001C0C5EB4|nr:EVE domain-containing protein [Clostridium estertheticum]MBU3174892.1 EVE domain-containing protein [Clostridium estertheticum]
MQVKEGDLIFGYNAGNQRELVALAEITRGIYKNKKGEEVIGITKIKDLKNTISIQRIKENKFFKDKFSEDIKLRGTIKPLSKEEFYELLRLI